MRSTETYRSGALQVGDHSTGDTHDVGWRRAEVVVPCSRCSSHFVVLQQVRLYEHAQWGRVTEGTRAALGLENPFPHIQIGAFQIETPRSQFMFPMSPLPVSAQVYTFPRQCRRNLR